MLVVETTQSPLCQVELYSSKSIENELSVYGCSARNLFIIISLSLFYYDSNYALKPLTTPWPSICSLAQCLVVTKTQKCLNYHVMLWQTNPLALQFKTTSELFGRQARMSVSLRQSEYSQLLSSVTSCIRILDSLLFGSFIEKSWTKITYSL